MKSPNYLWRLIATGFSFSIFGIGSLILFLIIFPLLKITTRDKSKQSKYMRKAVQLSWILFVGLMRELRLLSISIKNVEKLSNLRGSIIVANHPTLIDIVILIAYIKQSDCIVKESLSKNFYMKNIVSQLYMLNSLDSDSLLENCSKSLQQGNNLIIFPEGTRSVPGKKSRISRGAAHIALISKKNILPIKIDCHPLGLIKSQKWYNISSGKQNYTLDIRDEIILEDYLERDLGKQKTVRLITEKIRDTLEI